ncbi:HPP family protein [Vibrio sp. MACH09]|uniref:HPP family protein n=1 Tax=Vibrio sp. MACH09 TaxID=3025122 RepID=UPI002790867C|nr:HPP family protein [Vibrio sp. MACH09]GLO63135.1 HPP family protein [Vibrio sp. MACH09]
MATFRFALLSGLGATLTIAILAYADSFQSEFVLLMAPFGATAVLVFGVPDSPLAQAKNVILGHLITAFIGVVFVTLLPVNAISLSIATGLAVSSMLLTKTTHPPAGANPLLIMLSGQSCFFLVTPVLLGTVIIVVMGKLFQKLR